MKTYTAYYAITPNFGHGPQPTLDTVWDTHMKVCRIEATDLDDVFSKMQGERWSPNGEARGLIRSLGLHHTSMSCGDVILDEAENKFYSVDFVGFSELS